MFAWLKNAKDSLVNKVKQFANEDFKQATMATCALVAAADGSVDPSEKKKVAALIQKNEALQVYKAADLRDLFLAYCDKAETPAGRAELLSTVGLLWGNDEQSITAVRVALVIANADGVFDDDEKRTVREICGALSLNASEFGC